MASQGAKPSVEKEERLVSAFATPIFRHRWSGTEQVNAELFRLVLERAAASPGTKRSNMGGWQSGHDFMTWGGTAIATLGGWIQEAFAAVMARQLGTSDYACGLSVTAWANVNRDGDYNRHHTHANNHWSGVYYVTLGRPDPTIRPNGAIEFMDPRPAVGVYDLPGQPAVSSWTVEPEPGLMLLFPSWLRHGVLPFRGEGERISIAFNLRVADLRLEVGRLSEGSRRLAEALKSRL